MLCGIKSSIQSRKKQSNIWDSNSHSLGCIKNGFYTEQYFCASRLFPWAKRDSGLTLELLNLALIQTNVLARVREVYFF